jgi:cyanophycinase
MQLNTRTIVGLIALLFCLRPWASGAQNYRTPDFDYFVTGDPSLPHAAHTTYGLALMGGGGSVEAAFRFIAAHGGHGHMVILRAVHDDSFDPKDGDYGDSFATQWGPVTSAETIVFHDRKAAFDPRVIKALHEADGIFLAGGDQANYVKYWKGTPVQRELNAHVRANRPIGGSSAGLAVLGHFSYTALDGGSLESKVALRQPGDASVTLEDDFLHFRGMDHVITDTHFSRRCRLGRLIVFVSRINAEHPNAHAFGVGVDEKTALLVEGDGIARLAEGSTGSAWVVQAPGVLDYKVPLSLEVRVERLAAGSALHVDSGDVDGVAAESTEAIENGQPTGHSPATSIMLRSSVRDNEG